MSTYTKTEPRWTFSLKGGHNTRTTALHLGWELNGDPISDDWAPTEITAAELMRRWLRTNPDRGTGLVRIYWYVAGEGIFEHAPFQRSAWPWLTQDFLTHYTTPMDPAGRAVNWARLPVEDKLWTPTRGDKGGFIQSATGWKPSPLQPTVPLALLVDAAEVGRVNQTALETTPTCSICRKPLPKRGPIWEPAEGTFTHMNSRCPASFSRAAHDELLPGCGEDHDLFDHKGLMHPGGLASIRARLRETATHA